MTPSPVRHPVIGLCLLLAAALTACSSGDRAGPADLAAARTTTIGVNSYLWRGALETLSFMPVVQADAQTGILLTDWYANPQTPTERVKVNVYVLDQALRADALKVSAFRQENRGGAWVDVPVRADTVQKLEEAILAQARSIRQGTVAGRR